MRSTVSPQAGHLFAAEGEAVAGRSKALFEVQGIEKRLEWTKAKWKFREWDGALFSAVCSGQHERKKGIQPNETINQCTARHGLPGACRLVSKYLVKEDERCGSGVFHEDMNHDKERLQTYMRRAQVKAGWHGNKPYSKTLKTNDELCHTDSLIPQIMTECFTSRFFLAVSGLMVCELKGSDRF